MNEDEIPGTMVMISTLLWNDPYEKRGEIGVITKANVQSDDFFVVFEDNTQGLYSSNALHILKPPDQIWKMILGQSGVNLTERAKRNFSKIALLLQYGNEVSKRTAYRLTSGNEYAEFFATSTLQYLIGIRPAYRVGR